jgi:hypothetical protein
VNDEYSLPRCTENSRFKLVKGNLYRIKSRNLPYGVYDGAGGFIGIREKFNALYLFTELDWDQGPPYGTVKVLEDLGPIPAGIELTEGWWEEKIYRSNRALYDYLAADERRRVRIEGYGRRP